MESKCSKFTPIEDYNLDLLDSGAPISPLGLRGDQKFPA